MRGYAQEGQQSSAAFFPAFPYLARWLAPVFGDAWLALGLWRLVGLDVLMEQLLPQGREDVPWPLLMVPAETDQL